MCDMCECQPTTFGEFLPPTDPNAKSLSQFPWLLAKSNAPEEHYWPKGVYGLVRRNTPEYIFDFPSDPKCLYDELWADPFSSHDFLISCRSAGFNGCGMNDLVTWFKNRLHAFLTINDPDYVNPPEIGHPIK